LNKKAKGLLALAVLPGLAVLARGGAGEAAGPVTPENVPIALSRVLECGAPGELRAEGILENLETGNGSRSPGQSLAAFVAHRWPKLATNGFVADEASDRAVYAKSQSGAIRMVVVTERNRGGTWNVTKWAACNSVLLAGTEGADR